MRPVIQLISLRDPVNQFDDVFELRGVHLGRLKVEAAKPVRVRGYETVDFLSYTFHCNHPHTPHISLKGKRVPRLQKPIPEEDAHQTLPTPLHPYL